MQVACSHTQTFFDAPGFMFWLNPLPTVQQGSDDATGPPHREWAKAVADTWLLELVTEVTLLMTFPLFRINTVTSVPVPPGTFIGLAGLLGPQVIEFCLFWTVMVLDTEGIDPENP